jgi:hypothetical protein
MNLAVIIPAVEVGKNPQVNQPFWEKEDEALSGSSYPTWL